MLPSRCCCCCCCCCCRRSCKHHRFTAQDGPTTTHGGMATGAAFVAAKKFGAAEVVDPRGFFVGELKTTLEKYPHIGPVVPAMGYSEEQVGGRGLQRSCL